MIWGILAWLKMTDISTAKILVRDFASIFWVAFKLYRNIPWGSAHCRKKDDLDWCWTWEMVGNLNIKNHMFVLLVQITRCTCKLHLIRKFYSEWTKIDKWLEVLIQNCVGGRGEWPWPAYTFQGHRSQLVYFGYQSISQELLKLESSYLVYYPDDWEVYRGGWSCPSFQGHKGQLVFLSFFSFSIKILANIEAKANNCGILLHYLEDWVMHRGHNV